LALRSSTEAAARTGARRSIAFERHRREASGPVRGASGLAAAPMRMVPTVPAVRRVVSVSAADAVGPPRARDEHAGGRPLRARQGSARLLVGVARVRSAVVLNLNLSGSGRRDARIGTARSAVSGWSLRDAVARGSWRRGAWMASYAPPRSGDRPRGARGAKGWN
jgi:hypothetical protein